MLKLGVNIDHVATLREARYRGRGEGEPDPVAAALTCELAGAHGITAHLREDRRHIQDRDVWKLRQLIQTRLNLEMANTPEIASLALQLKPDIVCVVPERRQEVTTEGGLDVAGRRPTLTALRRRRSQPVHRPRSEAGGSGGQGRQSIHRIAHRSVCRGIPPKTGPRAGIATARERSPAGAGTRAASERGTRPELRKPGRAVRRAAPRRAEHRP